jgi:hypothetical protein
MSLSEEPLEAQDFLTPEETSELAAIQRDASVIGYALITNKGAEIEANGMFREMSAPVFANVFDLATKLGSDFGEPEAKPLLFLESGEIDIACVSLTSARAIIVKRKGAKVAKGLRSVC